METAKNAVNYVAETVQSAVSGTSKEANKEVAKDSNATIGTRANAAVDAVGDSFNENKHDAKASAHKEAAKH